MTTVDVTAEHIANGTAASCTRCPVALAITDAVPEATGAYVTQLFIILHRGDERLAKFRTPPSAVTFINDLTQNKRLTPFTFDLDYPAVTR
jgi:hypothetical protein